MKCMAMRIDDKEGHDLEDIKNLVKIVGIKNDTELFDLVESFYPKKRIEQKVYFGIRQIMEDIDNDSDTERKTTRFAG